MNADYNTKKLNYQLQQMAFQKYPFQINNKTFFCLQTYFEDQLLNGVELELKQAKGIVPQPQKIAYQQQNHQIIMYIGSNIVSYNTQKRTYSLITKVNGFVEILRTYNCKMTNKTYIYWLQSEKSGQNTRCMPNSKQKLNSTSQLKELKLKKKKITSILDFDKILDSSKKKDSIIQEQCQQQLVQSQQKGQQKKRVRFNQKQTQKSAKKVRIDLPQQNDNQQNQKQNNNHHQPMKMFSICIYDLEKKLFLHRENFQIQQQQIISEIFIYFLTEKVDVNDQIEERANIFYKKIIIDEQLLNAKSIESGFVGRMAKRFATRKVERFNVTSAIMEIPVMKYNTETDQYIFKDFNTVYSLQVYQLEHEITVNNNNNNDTLRNLTYPKSRIALDHKKKSNTTDKQSKRNSIQMKGEQIDELSREIEEIASKMRSVVIDGPEKKQRDKYGLKVCEEIELVTEQDIVDIALSEVYLVVLTQQFIRFYSIFNLNTLLFKCEISNIKELPPAVHVELNKSYLLITHENSTLISSYSILQGKLKFNSTCEVEIEHCQSIVKVFMNSYNCEVAILASQFEIQGRITNLLKSKRVISSPTTTYKKSFLDISLAYINFSSTKCETHPLFIKNQKFRNILACKWHSEYLIETENQIIAKEWRESFENMRCSCIHPTGQYLIIGFADCFKIYAVTHEGLQNTFMTDVLKDCQSITYSQYGDQFAVGSASTIAIYGSYNCTKKYLILLPVGSIVQNLQYRGYNLICTLKSKKIIVYNSQLNYKQLFSYNPKQYLTQNKHELSKKPGQSAQNLMALTIKRVVLIEIHSLFYDLQLNVLIFSSGQKIFFLNTLTNESLGSFQFEPISAMQYNKQLATLFIGTVSGELIAFPWPNKPSNIISELPRFHFHSSKIIKIKITSDFKYLMTIGADMAFYKCNVNYVLNLKKLKGNEIIEYKSSKSSFSHCNFLNSKGICLFSHSQQTQKVQAKKQLEEQVVNTVFMLPQQRLKQKQNLLQKISVKKNQLNIQNLKQYEPMQQESVNLRNKIIKIKNEIQSIKKVNAFEIQSQKNKHQQQTNTLLNKYSEMNFQQRMLKLQFQEQKQKTKQNHQKQYEQLVKENQQKEKQLLKQIQLKKIHSESQKNNFFELELIDQEKQAYLRKQLQYYQQQFDALTSTNGKISCQNSNIQKQILILKYRIQELKFVIINANHSIEKLQGKEKKQKQEKLVFENLLLQNTKVNVSQMEKKYIKATKQLIEKNKLIDINLVLYEKEKQILVKLQKTVQKTESQIDRIVDSLQQQKQFRKYLIQRSNISKQKLSQFTERRNHKKFKMKKRKADLKNFFNELHQLQKKLQSCLKQNKRQKTSQTHEVIQQLQKLQNFGIEKIKNKQKQKTEKLGSQKSLKRIEQRRKTSNIDEQEVKRKEERQSTSSYNNVFGDIKKSSKFIKEKKGKKLRFSSQQNDTTVNDKSEQLVKYNEEKKREKMILSNKKMFQEQFSTFKKDQLLNNTISGSFRLSTQRKLSPSTNFLQKTSTKYDYMKTEGNVKTQRYSSSNKARQRSPEEKINLWGNTNRETISSNLQMDIFDGQVVIERKKHDLIKKLSTQDKLINKINNDKRIFMTSKNRLHQQNQDLLNSYNSLTHENKYFQNLIKVYENTIEQQTHNYRLNPPHSHQSPRFMTNPVAESLMAQSNSSNRLNLTSTSKFMNLSQEKIKDKIKKLTPFEQYIKNKEIKKTDQPKKETNQSIQKEKKTNEQVVAIMSKAKKPKTSQLKRVKTVPSVQFNF